ncbi:cobaltochelatase subunit CobN [Pseudomonas aeruginosa]|uniref:cobaltochelatase subunit CobN n=1 Tax=Pseudomonas aeruginosa TaxID=287 RepID=UPI002DB6580B|nr:cobaltochelatase subunit CobN [Pseudomonas aeruginosa]MEB6190592.1 cobaltochelatase subunit CobN [Pseudomonas aeruginosa]
MHLLRTQPGGFVPDDGIAHLAQTPAELVILCSGDSHLALLAEAARALPDDYPSLRLANPMQLQNHASVDLYVEEVLRHARVILLSLHGGIGYWRYGVEQLVALAERGALLIPVPGDDRPDPELSALGNLPAEQAERFWQYLRQGGLENAGQFYRCLASQCLGRGYAWREPQALPRVALFHPRHAEATLEHWRADWQAGRPVVALLFYRTHLQAANTAFIARFCERLAAQGLNPLPIALASLKESACLAQVEDWLERSDAALIVNTTGFAQSNPEAPELRPFRRDVPVLQAICSLDNRPLWLDNPQGLGPRDLAMHVALPELDGRIVTRPISFKGLAWRSERSESDVVCYLADDERMDFVAELARRWAELARKPNAEKRVALVLANYPTRDGRIGNGVGLDTPAAALNILRALRQQGYPVDGLPASGTELIRQLLGGVSNDLEHLDLRPCAQSLALDDYLACFARLPERNRQAVLARWGEPQQDPMFRDGRMMVAGLRYGLTFVGIQPARGYQLDPAAVYHDPDLVPPHGYLAFYFWLRHAYRADALLHVGKHGNLEWLPGKGVGLSAECWPDALLGPLPNIYPFIVNDPGEGAQAKRRTQAVIIDHLMPPLTRAESYGPLRDLERLADEFYDASLLDPRRAEQLRGEILVLLRDNRLDREIGLQLSDDPDSWLPQLDAYLCDLKESQIRDGLHVFGESPSGRLRLDTLLALLRVPRGDGKGANAGLLKSLADDLGLGFDPLACDMGEAWQGAIEERLWETRADLAEVYLNWGGYAYGAADDGTPARERFAQRLERLQAVLHNQDNREHDLLDSNDYYQFQGGMLAAVETLRGAPVASYHGDHSQPDNPRIRTLKEELNRVVRARAVNPKWIAGMKRHGYKGAFELAATVDYLCAFDATSELIDDHQYALLADAYLLDAETREFVRQHNPQALRDMAERLVEAQRRGLWQEPGAYREALENLLLDVEEE